MRLYILDDIPDAVVYLHGLALPGRNWQTRLAGLIEDLDSSIPIVASSWMYSKCRKGPINVFNEACAKEKSWLVKAERMSLSNGVFIHWLPKSSDPSGYSAASFFAEAGYLCGRCNNTSRVVMGSNDAKHFSNLKLSCGSLAAHHYPSLERIAGATVELFAPPRAATTFEVAELMGSSLVG